MERNIIKKLKKIIGDKYLSTASEDLLCYSYDGTGMEYRPAAVAFPGSAQEISRIMLLAGEYHFPVIPRGAGTGMTGGSLAVAGGLVLVLSRLNRIVDIDPENQIAIVEPGVITGQFQTVIGKRGLFYPPDPASLHFCTMGGNVANGAGGPSAIKYGVTRDYVIGLEVVLANGDIMQTGVRTAKGVVGYDLTRLFVGSEGTLGIITKIIVRLLSLPTAKNTFQVTTRSLRQATKLAVRIVNSGLLPSTLEYMDRSALEVVNSFLPDKIPPDARALLLIEVDGDELSVANQSKRLVDFLQDREEFPDILEIKQAEGNKEVKALWAARRAISPASFQVKPHKINEDVVVPRSRIADLVDFTETLAEELNLHILTFGHVGDGNIHINIMLDKKDPQEFQHGVSAKKRIFEKVIELSGTLSGEHGIGLTKSAFLPLELDQPSLNVMQNIKKLFDPQNILNPGKIFPESSHQIT